MIWFAGVLLSGFSFLLGRILSQSEQVLAEKRRVYEEFLRGCPVPNEVYENWSEEVEMSRGARIHEVYAPLLLYASPTVAQAVGVYLQKFGEADQQLSLDSPPLAPAYLNVAKAHNDIALEMRRDSLGWSIFGHRGKSRLPPLDLGQK